MSERPTLVFATPVAPSGTGNGLAMRAHALLSALAKNFAVTVVLDPIYAAPGTAYRPPSTLTPLYVLEPGTNPRLPRNHYDVLFAFRLAALDGANACQRVASFRESWLDLDEVESVLWERIEALALAGNDLVTVESARRERERTSESEVRASQRFDRILVSSRVEADRAPSGRASIHVVPNAVAPPSELPAAEAGEAYAVGFIGTLGYGPNEDAVCWFADEVLPRLSARSQRPVEFVVAGSGMSSRIAALAGRPGVRLLGAIADVGDFYLHSNVVVLPLRAGGGTRIKALEAFAYGRPVISTTLGLEGIDVVDGVHALVAETSEAIVRACLRLQSDSELVRHLATCARSFVLRRHSPAAVQAAIDAVVHEVIEAMAGGARSTPAP